MVLGSDLLMGGKHAIGYHCSMVENLLEKLFLRDKHVCPWWYCFTFDNIFRKLIHHPEKMLQPYVVAGNTVLDVGPGMGYFTIPLARMVGGGGKVIAADVQPEMLKVLRKRAKKAHVDKQLVTYLCKADSLGLSTQADFVLAFWMVHEVPDQIVFFKEIKSLLKASGTFLLSEPFLHVNQAMYEATVKMAESVGFVLKEKPRISFSRSALFTAS
jgi:ubiquinone/menaquinone biosynthesis C-methylase UbiE